MSFVYHPEVAENLKSLTIEAIGVLNGKLFEEQLFPASGKSEETPDEMRVRVIKRTHQNLHIELIGRIKAGDNYGTFEIIFSNRDTVRPPGNLEGTVGVKIEGNAFIDSQPMFQAAHCVQTVNTLFVDTMQLCDGNIADQQETSISFVVGFGPTASYTAAQNILEPDGVYHEAGPEPLDVPIPKFAPIGAHELDLPAYLRFLQRTKPCEHMFGHSKTPNQAGAQKRFGWFPEPSILPTEDRSEVPGEHVRMVKAELMRAHGRWPLHLDFLRHIPVPDRDAIYYTGSLSEHSYNRCGRPVLHVSPPEAWIPFESGYHGVYAPGGEWATSSIPQLAWFGDDLWAKYKCVELGFWVMNQTHLGIGIGAGGYDTPYLQHQRAFWRLARLLFQCYRVTQREGWDVCATFWEHLLQMFSEAVKRWKPQFYGLKPRSSSEWVPGHETELSLAPWQIIGLPIAWILATDSFAARQMLEDLAHSLLLSYVQMGDSWGMRKIVLAENPSIGWEPSLNLHGIEFWPHASLKLIATRGHDFGMDADEILKANAIVSDQQVRFPGLAPGATYVPNTSNWTCGEFPAEFSPDGD